LILKINWGKEMKGAMKALGIIETFDAIEDGGAFFALISVESFLKNFLRL